MGSQIASLRQVAQGRFIQWALQASGNGEMPEISSCHGIPLLNETPLDLCHLGLNKTTTKPDAQEDKMSPKKGVSLERDPGRRKCERPQ